MAQKIDWQEQTPLNSDLSSSYLLWLLLSDIVSHVSPLLWPILSLRRFCKLSCSCKDTFQGIFAQLRKAGRWKHWRTKEKQRDNAQRRQLLGSKEHWAIHRSSWVYELSSQIFTFFVIFARVVTCADCPACVSCGMLSLTWFIAINFAAFKFTFWGGIPGEVAKPLPQEVTTRFLLQMTGTFVCVCVCVSYPRMSQAVTGLLQILENAFKSSKLRSKQMEQMVGFSGFPYRSIRWNADQAFVGYNIDHSPRSWRASKLSSQMFRA